jgi:apolipoprotein N-acyltransferase
VPTLPPVAWRLLTSALAGLLLALSFPPFHLGVVGLAVAVAALTLAVRGSRLRVAALCGVVAGLVFFLVLLRWLDVIGVDAWILVSAISALFCAAQAVGTALVVRLPAWPLWVAALWVAQEALRSRVPVGGFPWGRLAFGDTQLVLAPYAAVGGAPLVTFAVALCGALLAWAAVQRREPRRLAAALVVALLVLPLGAWLIPLPTDGRQVTVALVQGNVPRAGLDFNAQRQAVLNNHVEATLQLAADVEAGRRPAPDLVIWPENASDLDPYTEPAARAEIERAVEAVGVPVLVGAVIDTADGEQVENAGIVWDPVTGPGERYTKQQLVPFGEYIPFRDLLGDRIDRLGRIAKDFRAGTEPGVLDVGPARVADIICFEIAYDGIVREAVRGGGEVIVVQTNNATYGRTGQPPQQAQMSRLRAVEHGRTVLVAATSGISQIVQPDGSVTATTGEFEQRVLVEEVTLRSTLTLADRVGALPELLLTIVAVAAVIVAVVRRRHPTRPSGSEQA